MAPTPNAINPELRALLSQLRADANKASGRAVQLADALETLRGAISDLRDEMIRGRNATESLVEFLRSARP